MAPLKVVTIPRLELMVAVVLNCLVHGEIEYPMHDTVYWKDSMTVLQYIRNESRRFKTFVANRLAMIHDESSPDQWRHVDSSSNPADIASRGANGSETQNLQQWLHGPDFLWRDEKDWPEQPVQLPALDEETSN